MTISATTPAALVTMPTVVTDWFITRAATDPDAPHDVLAAAQTIHYEDGAKSWDSAVRVTADAADWAIQELDEADWALGGGSNLPAAVRTHGLTREQVGAARMGLVTAWLRLTDGQVTA